MTLHGPGLYLGILLTCVLICAALPTINIYFRFKTATSLWVFDIPTSLLFNSIAAGLIVVSFAVLNMHWVVKQPIPVPITVVAAGILLGVAAGTLLNLIFVEQLLGLDKLPQTH